MADKEPLYPHIPRSRQGSRPIVASLEMSSIEEKQAVRDYTRRATEARQSGDEETARLFEHIAAEEETHAKEFRERIQTLKEATNA